MNSLKYSQKIILDAKKILAQTKITKILSRFGDVRIGGSLYTGLMFDPDIDIAVACYNPRKSAVAFLNLVISKRLFQKYQYGDFEKFPRKNRPKRHIVVLILEQNKIKWEIEIWFVNKHFAKQIKLEEKLLKLPHNIKEKIIKEKAERSKKGLDKKILPSFEIYKKYF